MSSDLTSNEIFSNVPCGIVVLDKNKQIIFINTRIQQLTGLPSSAIIGNNLCSIGLGAKDDSNSISGQEWWEWAEGATIHLRASIQDANSNRIPVFISGKRGKNKDSECILFLCVFDTAHFEEWAVETPVHTVPRESFHGLVGRTAPMQELYGLIEKAALTDVNVVLQGESGTGKELVAAAIHTTSVRNKKPLVRVNCAALAETLLESELFGHVKGAFTGAYKDRAGNFEAAHGGTILLDEVGEISPTVQVKLLRVLQERVVVRVGDNQEIPVDVRIIAATNKNLRSLVQKGKFRQDLFYRLNVFPLNLPSLKERRPDIPLLCSHFIRKYREETGKNILSISADAMRLLMDYCWPGNVRELENTIEHAFVLCTTDEVLVTDLPHELRVKAVREGLCAEKFAGLSSSASPTVVMTQKINGRLNITREILAAELEKHAGNKSAAARSMGISKVGLWKKMKKLGMQ
ncbi:MAG: sigma 54-interacting transcriptional regulator [Chitinispirillaceae bacterium]|nr:sigma 54-interacting transcriptional regulator [Chitinispirillaceae bacterium]